MISKEYKATFAISGLFTLRMLALFMVLPVLPLYAKQYESASPMLLGWVIGIYGFTQALFQLPFGRLSDLIGRRAVVILGLTIFMIGSLVAAKAQTLEALVVGRALQGAGAIGSTLLALVSDLTTEQTRTRCMAIVGVSIGASFMVAMILGPLISASMGLPGLFWVTFLLGLIGMLWFVFVVPQVPRSAYFEARPKSIISLLKNKQLFRLNLGVMILHAQFTSCFLFIPKLIVQLTHYSSQDVWKVYLPALIGALLFIGPLSRMADKDHMAKPLMVFAILMLGLSECFLGLYTLNHTTLIVALVVFFASFSLLEAQLPAWVSKAAPSQSRGTALGLYSTCQFLGIFLGGVVGGALQGAIGTFGLILWCILLVSLWLVFTLDLSPPSMVALSKQQKVN